MARTFIRLDLRMLYLVPVYRSNLNYPPDSPFLLWSPGPRTDVAELDEVQTLTPHGRLVMVHGLPILVVSQRECEILNEENGAGPEWAVSGQRTRV